MSTVLDILLPSPQRHAENHPPAGLATAEPTASPRPAADACSLPPAAPCDAPAEQLDLFAVPGKQTRPCGSPLFWQDAYGNLHCWACLPPSPPELARRKLSVVLAPGGGYEWEDFRTTRRRSSESGHGSPPAGSSQPVPDAREQSIDEWWDSLTPYQEAAWAAVEIARRSREAREASECAATPAGSADTGPPQDEPKKKTSSTRAKKKTTAGTGTGRRRKNTSEKTASESLLG